MSQPGARSIARNTGYLAATQAIGVAARLVWVVVAARLLGPDRYALLAYSQAWQLAFLPLALFGLGPAVTFSIAPDRSRAPAVAAQALALRLATTFAAALACYALSRVIAPDARALPLIAVLVVGLAGRSLALWAHTLFTAYEVNEHGLRLEAMFRLLDLGTALAILFAGGSLLALVAASTVVAWLQAACALAVVHRRVVPLAVAWGGEGLSRLLALALPALLITLAADWRMSGALVLFRNLHADGILFGQFALAMQAIGIAAIVPAALAAAAHPVLRRSVVRGDGKDLVYASVVQRSAPLLGAAAGLAGLTLGEPLFRFAFGEAFATAGRLVGLTLWCLVPLAAANGYPAVLIARGQFRAQVVTGTAGTALMAVAMMLLIGPFGAVGAVTAVFLGYAAPALAVFALASRQGLADSRRDLARPLAAVALALGAWLALSPLSRWLALPVALAVLGLAAAKLGVVSATELRQLRAALGGRPA